MKYRTCFLVLVFALFLALPAVAQPGRTLGLEASAGVSVIPDSESGGLAVEAVLTREWASGLLAGVGFVYRQYRVSGEPLRLFGPSVEIAQVFGRWSPLRPRFRLGFRAAHIQDETGRADGPEAGFTFAVETPLSDRWSLLGRVGLGLLALESETTGQATAVLGARFGL